MNSTSNQTNGAPNPHIRSSDGQTIDSELSQNLPPRRGTISTSGKPPAQSGSAAVPITIYRELVAELQHTQQRLREASDRNDQLAEQNQKLRHEVEQMIHAALHLRSVANRIQPDAPIVPELAIHYNPQSHNRPESNDSTDSADSSTNSANSGSTTDAPISNAEHCMEHYTEHCYGTDDENREMASAEVDHLLVAAIARQFPKASATSASPDHPPRNNEAAVPQQSVSLNTPDGTVTLKLPTPQRVTTEQAVQSHQRQGRSSKPSGGGWLTLLVVVIVISAFGAGFLAMLFVQGQRTNSR